MPDDTPAKVAQLHANAEKFRRWGKECREEGDVFRATMFEDIARGQDQWANELATTKRTPA